MSDDKVISMAQALNDGTMQSPKDALNSVLKLIGEDGVLKKSKKILIICLDDTDNQYNVKFEQAGLNMSQCTALCEIAKTIFLREMGYIAFPEDI